MGDEWWRRACAAADAANAEDPRRTSAGPWEGRAFELVYADRLEHWVSVLVASPSPELTFACRALHLRRWQVPRSGYPEGRAGYHAWRRTLTERHVAEARGILETMGGHVDTVKRVEQLIRKAGRESDPEVQALQDAASLVTLELQLGELASRLPSARLVEVLRRTLAKMSARARALVARVDLDPDGRRLLERAASFDEAAG